MKLLSLLVIFVLWLNFLCESSPLAYHKQWHLWKTEHAKAYSCQEEEIERHAIWLTNKKYIDEHNRQRHLHGYTLKMNHLGDLTTREYQALYNCYHGPSNVQYFNITLKEYNKKVNFVDIPDEVDWRTKNAVTKVKDQSQCHSCYAFSAVGALEGAHALAHDKLVSLSEQNVIDCSVPYGNHGCNGGNMYQTFQYVIDNNGIDKEDSYLYKGKQGQCQFQRNAVGGTEAGIVQIPSGSEKQLQLAVATAGPISVSFDGSSNAFRFYEKGVFDEPNCSTSKLTQAALLVGYGKADGKSYWLVKNSWGTNWGMSGYIMMAKDKSNQCGIATDASFPTL